MAGHYRRYVVWGLLAGLAYALWPRPFLVDLAEVQRGHMAVTVDAEGETRVREIFVVSSPVTGRLRRIDMEIGDSVAAGDTVVARIEPIDPAFLDIRSETEARAAVDAAAAGRALSEARLAEAKAELDFAEAELNRARRLIRRGTISERALDEAERAFRTASAEVARAEAELQMRASELAQARARLVSPLDSIRRHNNCECVPIASPVDGQVLRLVRESEGVVQAGDPLLEIGDPSDLEIVADFLSSDAVRIEPGQRVIIEDWGGEAPLEGRVRRVEPAAFTKVSALGIEEQRVNVIMDFSDPPSVWQRLQHGFRVEARVVLWEGDDIVKTPLTALFRDGSAWRVFVEREGRARAKTVDLGRTNGTWGEVRDGLEAGERVVLHPGDRIAEGSRIAPR